MTTWTVLEAALKFAERTVASFESDIGDLSAVVYLLQCAVCRPQIRVRSKLIDV